MFPSELHTYYYKYFSAHHCSLFFSSPLSCTQTHKLFLQVPPSGPLGYLLAVDGQVTMAFALYFAHPVTRLQRFVYLCCKVLEISGHGVPWFFLSFFLICLHYLTEEPVYLQYGLNILLVLIVDIITVAPAKLVFKRPRPSLNEGPIPMSMSQVDQYAFPSGHASRCVALAAYFCYMPPFNSWTHLWYLWGLLVSLSRITLGRHHVLDVIAGMGAGLIIFELVKWPNLLQGVS